MKCVCLGYVCVRVCKGVRVCMGVLPVPEAIRGVQRAPHLAEDLSVSGERGERERKGENL